MNIQDLYCGVGKIPPRSKGQGVLCDLTKENSNKNFMISQKNEKLLNSQKLRVRKASATQEKTKWQNL